MPWKEVEKMSEEELREEVKELRKFFPVNFGFFFCRKHPDYECDVIRVLNITNTRISIEYRCTECHENTVAIFNRPKL